MATEVVRVRMVVRAVMILVRVVMVSSSTPPEHEGSCV
jgi:hypothetical protein